MPQLDAWLREDPSIPYDPTPLPGQETEGRQVRSRAYGSPRSIAAASAEASAIPMRRGRGRPRKILEPVVGETE